MSDISIDSDEPPAEIMEPTIVSWREIPLQPLPELRAPIYLCVTAHETWCAICGSDGTLPESTASNRSAQKTRPTCIRCGSPNVVRAVDVLRSAEYTLAQ